MTEKMSRDEARQLALAIVHSEHWQNVACAMVFDDGLREVRAERAKEAGRALVVEMARLVREMADARGLDTSLLERLLSESDMSEVSR